MKTILGPWEHSPGTPGGALCLSCWSRTFAVPGGAALGLRETQLAWVAAELERLGCQRVCASFVSADQQVTFVRGQDTVSCQYALARSYLMRQPADVGDDAVWEILTRVGHSGLA